MCMSIKGVFGSFPVQFSVLDLARGTVLVENDI